jgi:peptidyl-prolyl cis-trans isomerase B (cyclophilin B)
MITLHTNMGDIEITLDTQNTPKTAENFISYAKAGHYNGTIFHRVINGFMIQGGGFLPGLDQKETNSPIENEADKGKSNKIGTIAMARTSDPHSASSQFFINVKDNDFLDHKSKTESGWGYCVFGEVAAGQDVVDKIKAVETTSKKGFQDVPVNDVIIESVTVSE